MEDILEVPHNTPPVKEPVIHIQTCFRTLNFPMTGWINNSVVGDAENNTPIFDGWLHAQILFATGSYNSA